MSLEILTGEKRITRIIRTFLFKYSYMKRQTTSPSLVYMFASRRFACNNSFNPPLPSGSHSLLSFSHASLLSLYTANINRRDA